MENMPYKVRVTARKGGRHQPARPPVLFVRVFALFRVSQRVVHMLTATDPHRQSTGESQAPPAKTIVLSGSYMLFEYHYSRARKIKQGARI